MVFYVHESKHIDNCSKNKIKAKKRKILYIAIYNFLFMPRLYLLILSCVKIAETNSEI